MIQRVVGPAMQGAVWVRESVLSGVSRVCLDAIDLWSRARAAVHQARRSLGSLRPSVAWFRRRGARVAAAVPSVAPARALGLALDLALAGGTIFVVILMHREIYSQMQVRPSYRVRLEELRLAFRPSWAPQETVTVGVPVDAGLARQARGCTPGLVGEVAHRLEREPWVRRVTGVRRVGPDRLEARVELRRPQACILRGSRGMFIDADGVRLPDFRSGLMPAAGCYEIAGVDDPAPEVGAAWNHPGVRAALDVIQSLETYRVDRVLLVSRIDVSNVGGRKDSRESEILCWTAAGVPVAWGRPSTTTQYGENPVETKMKLLALALEAFPGLRGLERVDLRFDRVVVRPRPEWRVLASAAMPGAATGSVPR